MNSTPTSALSSSIVAHSRETYSEMKGYVYIEATRDASSEAGGDGMNAGKTLESARSYGYQD